MALPQCTWPGQLPIPDKAAPGSLAGRCAQCCSFVALLRCMLTSLTMGPLTEVAGRQFVPLYDDAENDENQQPGVAACSGSSSSFSALTAAFSLRVAELQQALCLRIEGLRALPCRRHAPLAR